jgi:hypothetical protein
LSNHGGRRGCPPDHLEGQGNMRHGIVGRKLGRSRPHYHALMDNLITS